MIDGFDDASETGLGAAFTCGSSFSFRIGVWGSDESDQSSNWKEFTNIVKSLKEETTTGNLVNSEVFMLTDNSTVESCVVKGSSSSVKLLGLIIRLRALTTIHGLRVHIFHMTGTRMIAQGSDGVSRGYLGEGIISGCGNAMKSFIPIHLMAMKRSPLLAEWIMGWSATTTIMLQPRYWFDIAHDIDGWKSCWDRFNWPNLNKGRVYQ